MLELLKSGCHVNILSFVMPVVIGVILIMSLVHQISPGSVLATRGMLFSRAQERVYNTIVLYFQHATNPVDQKGGVAIILHFLYRQLRQ